MIQFKKLGRGYSMAEILANISRMLSAYRLINWHIEINLAVILSPPSELKFCP